MFFFPVFKKAVALVVYDYKVRKKVRYFLQLLEFVTEHSATFV